MSTLREKLWLLQHPDTTLWLNAGLTAKSNAARREQLGIKAPTFASWLRKSSFAIKPQNIDSILAWLKKNHQIEVTRDVFEDSCSIEQFAKHLSIDYNSMDKCLDELYYSDNSKLAAHLIYNTNSQKNPSDLLSFVKGHYEVERNISGKFHSTIYLEVKHICTVDVEAQNSSHNQIVSVDMAIPLIGSEPFIYKGFVGEAVAGAGDALYWVLSSHRHSNSDMVFMVTTGVRQKFDAMHIIGHYITKDLTSASSGPKPIAYDVNFRKVEGDFSMPISEYCRRKTEIQSNSKLF